MDVIKLTTQLFAETLSSTNLNERKKPKLCLIDLTCSCNQVLLESLKM